MSRRGETGQILLVFALGLVALIGMMALAIDLASVYSLQQYERSVADAASLAGAQDLVTKDTRSLPTPAQQSAARGDALRLAAASLGATSNPSCPTTSDIVNCAIPGTNYQVTIKTPSPTAVTVDANRSVQVFVNQIDVSLTFARLFGQHDWKVGKTSVAGIGFGSRYALVTLRPPNPLKSGYDQYQGDIDVTGGTVVTISGDVGTNTNMVLSGTGSALNFPNNTDFHVYHYDTYLAWTPPPSDQVLTSLIPDPNYVIPARGTTTYTTSPSGQDTTNCGAEIAKAVAAGYVGHSSSTDPTKTYVLTSANTTCLMPGNYSYDPASSATNVQAILLEPGVYFFDKGMSIGATLIGGYQDGSAGGNTGVALVFPEANSTSTGAFGGNNATLVSLNGGSCFASSQPDSCTTYASPALDSAGTPIQVIFHDPATGDIIAPESLIVAPKDPNCQPTVQPYNTGCQDNKNNSINLPGGGNLFVLGVQYAPSDNVVVHGGAGGTGHLGQIIAWTVQYTGGSAVSEVYPGHLGNGTLRLDSACSGPGTPCNP